MTLVCEFCGKEITGAYVVVLSRAAFHVSCPRRMRDAEATS